ncbi:putative vacuolar ATP synthase, partial [Tubulinosema ratisbonensis]
SLAGNTNAIKSISSVLSGTSIAVPRVGFKCFLGVVMSELNTLLGMVFVWMILSSKLDTPYDYLISATAGIIVGWCNYYSSTAVGLLTSSLTIMDAKDKHLFSKLFVLELLASTMGVFGFVLGVFMRQKIGNF